MGSRRRILPRLRLLTHYRLCNSKCCVQHVQHGKDRTTRDIDEKAHYLSSQHIVLRSRQNTQVLYTDGALSASHTTDARVRLHHNQAFPPAFGQAQLSPPERCTDKSHVVSAVTCLGLLAAHDTPHTNIQAKLAVAWADLHVLT